MSFRTFNKQFWMITAAAILASGVTARLGFWQLSRAHEKAALQASIETQAALPSLTAAAFTKPQDMGVLHRRIILTGYWLPKHTLFLDNRQMDNKPGMFVLTPFEFIEPETATKKTILVQRGWLPRNFIDRNALPDVTTEAVQVTITGRVAASPSKLFEFKAVDTGALRQNVELEALAKEFQLDLLPYSLLQLDNIDRDITTRKQQEQLMRHWSQPDFGAGKNYGYMVQWWALSVLVVGLYAWFQLIHPNIKLKIKD